ncbi:CAMK protein kinase [Polytolypa hystricis UAMH7299]|uniref:CAMK protein kinase n=1 Tax=Polytolypa hystricis (strain UAMH7299) TaxID=1447883 RepID=A0A2B7XIX3_POLH7|nr:CAMK protein kinase [Polytolypa hystricis UAMH7299]
MDEATQPSTQPYTDPRRRGLNNSGLHDEDVADIICILHPATVFANNAVSATARCNPQHVLLKDELEYDYPDIALTQSDIALRLSSTVKDLSVGFCFGRHPTRCDIQLWPDDSEKRISNTHFRIYVTDDGILMLEDMSTNGTLVDDCLVRRGGKRGAPIRRMLNPGSIISVILGNPTMGVKFIVRIPSRDGFHRQYMDNLSQYLERVREVTKGPQDQTKRNHSGFLVSQQAGQAHGMYWNGGSVYNVTGQIGKGAFATVYKLATKDDGVVFACKELDKRRLIKNNSDQKVDNEMQIMRDLRHPNIVEFRDYYEHDKRWIYIIMEYVPCGELSTFLNQQKKISEELVKSITRQILHALQYLHRLKITHRDIKPDNILISSFDPLHVKLSDFGLSKVVQEETFMKTFCGTLLYCAPEVYPDYDNYKRGEARKRRRLRDPAPRTSPYNQSVDMWSLGAVLFHILSGIPPFTGRGDDRGAQMLCTIMTTHPDLDILRSAGISADGIDFVSKLLNRDPSSRPKERECFRHPWIAHHPDIFDYMELDGPDVDEIEPVLDVVDEEDEGEELDASQLRLNSDAISAAEEEQNEDSTPQDHGQIKRQRIGGGEYKEPHQEVAMSQAPAVIKYPSLPNVSSFDLNHSVRSTQLTPRPPLFGEITSRALESSGALGKAGAAFDAEIPEFQYQHESASSHDSFPSYNGREESPESWWALAAGEGRHRGLELPHTVAIRPRAPAPSLMGADSLVGHLRMESPGSAQSPVSTAPNTTTPEPREGSVSRDPEPNAAEDPPQQQQEHEFDDPANLPPVSASASGRSHSSAGNEKQNRNGIATYTHPGTGYELNDSVEQRLLAELAATIDERTGEEIIYADDDDAYPLSPASETPTTHLPPPPAIPRSSPITETFLKPPPLLGKLTPLPGSILDTPIRLESRLTSWGRGTAATLRSPDPMDTRIPMYALELTFWAPSIESRIAEGEPWLHVPGIMTILSTKASKCIFVNDVALHKVSPPPSSVSAGTEVTARLFGKLYTGDIITVYRNRDRGEFLKFKCEFYHGESRAERPESEAGFVIQRTNAVKGQEVGGGGGKGMVKTIQGVTEEVGTGAEAATTTMAEE